MSGRRTVLWTVAGVAAAAAGVGWQRWRSPPAGAASAAAAGPATGPQAAAGDLWQMRFATPDGQQLVMATLRGKPLVLNFWATWCPPCVKEMPELDRFARQFAGRGGVVVGVAIDSPAPVREFLKRTPVSYAIALGGMDGTDLSRALGNDSGALPFTAVFNRSGEPVQRKLGETNFDELGRWVQQL